MKTPGQLARRVLGPYFEPVGNFYRGLFMHVGKVADHVAGALPPGATCLDIGGGDGMVANALLQRRADISITMIDLAPEIGSFVAEEFSDRVKIFPATSVGAFASRTGPFDAILMTDVLHHVPAGVRAAFFADLRHQMINSGCRQLIVKEVGPRSLRGWFSVMSDKYITGDKTVSLVSPADVRELVEKAFGDGSIAGFDVDYPDYPNYVAVIRFGEIQRTA